MLVPTDFRLQPVYQHIDEGTIKVLSIDIFDTLLWRKVPRPNDLFLILGKKLKKEGWLIDAVPAEKFRDLRTKAERLARFQRWTIEEGEERKSQNLDFSMSQFKKWQQTTFKEVTLKEIYWQLHGIFKRITIEEMTLGKKGIINEADIDEVVSLEVALECDLSGFDQNIVNLIQYAHEKKVLVVLTSNTYFEKSQIEDLLEQSIKDVLPLIYEIYLSSEYRIGKGDGLFLKILEELQVNPQQMLHLGDNAETDVLAAERSNIVAVHYPKYDGTFEKALNREWTEVSLYQRLRFLNDSQGDYGLTALRSRICFDKALRELPKQNQFFWKYGATILGPLVTGFVHWIYERCKDLNEPEPLCIMREGRLYENLINAFAPYYPTFSMRPKELWASRHFITSAAIFYGNPNELLAVAKAHPLDRFTAESYCQYLGINIEKIPRLIKYAHVRIEEQGDFKEYIAKELSRLPGIVEEILKHAYHKRHRFLKYLRTLVNLETIKKIVLVDVGWNGTIQSAIQAILTFSGFSIEVHGLYLATSDTGDQALLKGHLREGFLFKGGYPHSLKAILIGSHYPLEKVAVTEIGSLIDIDDQCRIITRKMKVPVRERREVASTLQGIYAFCHKLGKSIQSKTIIWDSNSEALQEQLRAIFVGLATLPTSEEAKKLGGWNHDLVTRENDSFHTLAEDVYYKKFIADMLPKAAFHDPNIIWPAAFAAQRHPALASMAQAALLKTVPEDVFFSIDQFPLDIFLNHGKGYSLKPLKRLNLRSNPNRHFYVLEKIGSLKKPIRSILMRLHALKSLIKIIDFRFMLHDMESSKSKEIILKPQDLQIKMNENGVYVSEKELDIEYNFTEKNIYFVQINLCLGIL